MSVLKQHIHVDVAIVGAGVAGLSAAQTVVGAHPDLSVLVLEAQDYLGGRICTKRLGADALRPHDSTNTDTSGQCFEHGAMWMHGGGGSDQPVYKLLVQKLGHRATKTDWDRGMFHSEVPFSSKGFSECWRIVKQALRDAVATRCPLKAVLMSKWRQLSPPLRQAAHTLGYSESSWDNDESPDPCELDWKELSSAQQRAAATLGYTRTTWDNDSLEAPDEPLDPLLSQTIYNNVAQLSPSELQERFGCTSLPTLQRWLDSFVHANIALEYAVEPARLSLLHFDDDVGDDDRDYVVCDGYDLLPKHLAHGFRVVDSTALLCTGASAHEGPAAPQHRDSTPAGRAYHVIALNHAVSLVDWSGDPWAPTSSSSPVSSPSSPSRTYPVCLHVAPVSSSAVLRPPRPDLPPSAVFVHCRQVIVTVPLGVLKQNAIRFVPELPQDKKDAISRLGFGTMNKIFLHFSTIFWPDTDMLYDMDAGRQGGPSSFINLARVYPNNRPAVLLAPIVGEYAEWLETQPHPEQVAREAALATLRKLFPTVPEPIAVEVTRWHTNPYTRGSYSHVPPQSSFADYRTLATPFGRCIRLAGEHTNQSTPSTVHGALKSGYRAGKKSAKFASRCLKS